MAHHCHATACRVEVPPEMFMCKRHWFSLPRSMRNRIWSTYRVGPCDDMNPSDAYCEAAKACVIFVAEREDRPADTALYDAFLRTT